MHRPLELNFSHGHSLRFHGDALGEAGEVADDFDEEPVGQGTGGVASFFGDHDGCHLGGDVA